MIIKTENLVLLHLYEHLEEQKRGEEDPIFSQEGMQTQLGISKSSLSESLNSLVKENLIESKKRHVKKIDRFRNFYFLTEHGIRRAEGIRRQLDANRIRVRDMDKVQEMLLSELIKYLKRFTKPMEKGTSYAIKEEKPENTYKTFKELVKEGFKGLVISDVSPQKIRKEYDVEEDIFWLSEIEGENVLRPDRLDFEIMSSISSFLKENEKPVIILEGFEYLSSINGFDTCVRWLKTVNDIVAKNNGILILPINPLVFSEKEQSLLLQNMEIYEPRAVLPTEITYINIIKNITPDNFFNVQALLQPRRYVDFSDRKPEIRYFYGRENELKKIRDFLKSKSKVLCIRGIAGIGKTLLVAKLVEDLEMNIFWHRFYEHSTQRILLTKLGDFLSEMDRNKLSSYLRGKRVEMEEVLMIIEEDLKASNSLLIFDDFHKASDEIVGFFSTLKEIIPVKTIVIGREIPAFYTRVDTWVKELVVELNLSGLDKEGSTKLLKRREIKKSEWDRLYSITKGHPLMLELITPDTTAEAVEFIREEIIKKLEDKKRKVLEIASVFRYPFYHKAIIVNGAIEQEDLDDLVSKSLMVKSQDVYEVHEIIKNLLYDRLTESQREKYHKIAGEHYSKEKGIDAILEAVYHFINAADQKTASELAVKSGEEIVARGYLKEFITLLEKFDEKNVEREDWARILAFKGDIFSYWGEYPKSLELYREALEKGGDEMKARAFTKMGTVYRLRSQWNDSLEVYKKAIELSKRIDDIHTIAECTRGIGYVHWRKGEYSKAIECYNECIKRAEGIKDFSEIASANIELGNTYADIGEWEKAVNYFEKSIEFLDKIGARFEKARTYNNLGCVYKYQGNWDKAIEYLEKCMKMSEESANIRELAYALKNIGEVYARKCDFESAKRCCDKVIGLSERFGDKIPLAGAHMAYGVVWRLKKEWRESLKSLNNAIEIYEKLGVPHYLGETYLELGRLYKDKFF
ncbi:MAG: tetratricopeptide repeat protein, partial [Candidatus Thermoplasmatota archaeon]